MLSKHKALEFLKELGGEIATYPLERFSDNTHSQDFCRHLILDRAKYYRGTSQIDYLELLGLIPVARNILDFLRYTEDEIDVPSLIFQNNPYA